jgi:hypothetical protein
MTEALGVAFGRVVMWYGEPGTLGPFNILPPTRYRERYAVGGTLRHVTDAPPTIEVLDVTVTDRETGAAVTFPPVGPATAVLPLDIGPADVATLWRVAPKLADRARADVGRPPEQQARIARIVETTAEMGTTATRDRVAQALGRAGEDGMAQSDYKADVRAVGGWQAIKLRAREF